MRQDDSSKLEEFVTVSEAEEMLGKSQDTVYRYAKDKGWRTRKLGWTRLFHRKDVEKLKREQDEE